MNSNIGLFHMVGYNLNPILNQSIHFTQVDTKAEPPRAIWTHPYEDEKYLDEHPEVRDKVHGANSFGSNASPHREVPRRHSFNGHDATSVEVPPSKHKQGFLNKLKTKVINSMEQHNERRRQQQLFMQKQQQQMYNRGMQYGAPQYAYPQSYEGMGSGMGRSRRGMGGGMALPLLGGMAGGLLLGDTIGNDFGDGGGWTDGGGGWDGGGRDWGGGGF